MNIFNMFRSKLNNSFQFIVLPNTGIQICRNFTLPKEIDLKNGDIWKLAEKTAGKFKDNITIQILSEYIAVNKDIKATGWIPCDIENDESSYFRLTNPETDIYYLDLVIDTKEGAGKVPTNKIDCLLKKRTLKRCGFKKKYSLANFFIEKSKEASGERGSLIIDFGNSGISAIFAPSGKGADSNVACICDPFDPSYKKRSEDEKRILKSSMALLRVPEIPKKNPWIVMGESAEELIRKEPLCTYLFAPKKYVRYWPDYMKALEPSTSYEGINAQKDGLHSMISFVQLSIVHLLNTIISGIVNPAFMSPKPEKYPLIERIILTYPLTWRESDRKVFKNLFNEVVKYYLTFDKDLKYKNKQTETDDKKEKTEIEIELICSEPVAVAAYLIWESIFHYGVNALSLMNSTLGNISGEPNLRLLIIDIGGGSTDIAVVEIHWNKSQDDDIDVKFQMIESMRFNRAGDRLSHIIVTYLFNYMREKYNITEDLDFNKEPENYPGFSRKFKREAISKLNKLAESAKEVLSQQKISRSLSEDIENKPWELSKDDEEKLKEYFNLILGETQKNVQECKISLQDLEKWIRNDRQSEKTKGEPGFMDIFLFLKELKRNLDLRNRPPHAVVLSGRTTRLSIIKQLTMEYLNMPPHKVRNLKDLLPISKKQVDYENADKISVVRGAHRFRFGDNVRFIPLPERKIFNRYIGTVYETPDGLKLNRNRIYCKPLDKPPKSISIEIQPSTDLRIGHCFREDGVAEVIAVLSNKSTEKKQTATIDINDDYTVEMNNSHEDIILAEWVPGGSDIIVDNFNDTGKIDSNPKDFILENVIKN